MRRICMERTGGGEDQTTVRNKAVTFLELLIVVAILLILVVLCLGTAEFVKERIRELVSVP